VDKARVTITVSPVQDNVELIGRTLTITGTERDDDVKIDAGAGGTIIVRFDSASDPAFTMTFAAADVDDIFVRMRGGDDKVLIDDAIGKPATIHGDAGDDVLKAGSGNDTVEGGEGNDLIIGGAGDDVLGGGAGNDIIIGDQLSVWGCGVRPGGADTISGGSGEDLVWGDSVVVLDLVFGLLTVTIPSGDSSGGADVISGGAGNDILVGQGGNDRLFGDAGDDWLVGGPGKDRLDGGPGKDKEIEGNGGGRPLRDAVVDNLIDWKDSFRNFGAPFAALGSSGRALRAGSIFDFLTLDERD
jgi:Ca2+-binding RTX toxin-like protein